MLQDPYVENPVPEDSRPSLKLTFRLQFYEVSSLPTREFAKPPMAIKVDSEASKMAIYRFTRRQWPPLWTMVFLLIFLQGNQALVDPMDSDQKFTYFKMLVEMVWSTYIETPICFE